MELSKEIDPVNIYVITKGDEVAHYRKFVRLTDGLAVSVLETTSTFHDRIMNRYDSLPRVEEKVADELPELTISNAKVVSDDEININFETNGVKTLVILNDKILGTTEDKNIVIGGLKSGVQNKITLVPLSEQRRGTAQEIEIEIEGGYGKVSIDGVFIPKTPNTGRL